MPAAHRPEYIEFVTRLLRARKAKRLSQSALGKLLGKPQSNKAVLFPAMAQVQRLNRRKRATCPTRPRSESFKNSLGMILKRVRMDPHPVIDMLATPEVRLAAGLVFKNDGPSVDNDRPAKPCVQIR